jgi:OOP family OmpA-OmpF porin
MNHPSRLRGRLIAIVAAFMLMAPVAALAQSNGGGETPGNYIGIGVGANWLHDTAVRNIFPNENLDASVEYKTGSAAQLTFGHLSASGWRSEIELSFRRNDLDSIRRFNTKRHNASGYTVSYGVFFNELYDFQTGAVITPYLGLGAGVLRLEYRSGRPFGTGPGKAGYKIDDFDAGLGVQAIAGLKFNISDHVALALDYRYYVPVHVAFNPEFDGHDIGWAGNSLMLTLQFGFGGQEEQAPAQPAVPPPSQPMDSDNDGVNDNADQCPNTPSGTQVGSDGCPTDADNDGVPNAEDQCPHTPQGVEVNYQGCEVLKKRQLNSLHFAFDSSKLSSEDMRYLDTEKDKINQALQKHPRAAVEIAGYTDSIGTRKYNKGLSQRRTDSVRDYLVQHGVEPDQITSHGYGESDPVASNDTKAGRAKNRRVEVRLIGHRAQTNGEG